MKRISVIYFPWLKQNEKNKYFSWLDDRSHPTLNTTKAYNII